MGKKTPGKNEHIFPLLNPVLHCVSTGRPKPFSPSPSPPLLPNILAGPKVATAVEEREAVETEVASLSTVAAVQL